MLLQRQLNHELPKYVSSQRKYLRPHPHFLKLNQQVVVLTIILWIFPEDDLPVVLPSFCKSSGSAIKQNSVLSNDKINNTVALSQKAAKPWAMLKDQYSVMWALWALCYVNTSPEDNNFIIIL